MPRVPVPNQPSFLFNYNLFTINVRGTVVNEKNKLATLYVHGNTIRGTQTIVGIPVLWTGFSHKGRIFVHGYFLTPYTPFASTRFRIPLIVSIWKLYLGHCNVIANMTETRQDTFITATTDTESEFLKPACVMLSSGLESDEYMNGHFSVNAIAHTRHTMYTATEPVEKHHKFLVGLVGAWSYIFTKIRARALPMLHSKTLTTRVSPLPMTQEKQASARVNTLPIEQEKRGKFITTLVNPVVEGTYKLSTHLVTSIINKVYKLSAKLVNPKLNQQHKLSVMLHRFSVKNIAKLSGNLIRPVTKEVHKLKFHVIEPVIQSLHKLKAHLKKPFIEELLGRIEWIVSKRKIEQKGYARVDALRMTKKSAVSMTGMKYIGGKLGVGMHMLAQKVDSFLRIRAHEELSENSTLTVHSSQVKGDVHQYIHLTAETFRNDIRLLMNYTTTEEPVELNIDVIPGLAERYVRVKPNNAPQVRWLNLLVTVMNTETLTFIKFATDEMAQDTTVRVSMFEHEVVSLLQWYLHGGLVTNEGYGNEVIFDLGEADDGSSGSSTIPPIPSRQWSGGYVEDPFKGVGYEPTSNSTGYVSPKVTDWLSGSKMYWGKASEPFQEA